MIIHFLGYCPEKTIIDPVTDKILDIDCLTCLEKIKLNYTLNGYAELAERRIKQLNYNEDFEELINGKKEI